MHDLDELRIRRDSEERSVLLPSDSSPKSHALQVLAKSSTVEPEVTPTMEQLAKCHEAQLMGLVHRLTTELSLAEKIDVERRSKRVSTAQAADEISDALRNTVLVDDSTYVSSSQAIIDGLRDEGYSLWVKNTWQDSNNPYRDDNVALIASDGTRTELQFYTSESFEAKSGEMHDFYTVVRVCDSKNPKHEKQIKQFTERSWEPPSQITVPERAGSIA